MYNMHMSVKFPKPFNLRFAKQDAPIYHEMQKSAKENEGNPRNSLTVEILIACRFYLKYKDRIKELETKQ